MEHFRIFSPFIIGALTIGLIVDARSQNAPSGISDKLQSGVDFMENDSLEQAAEAFRQVLSLEPDNRAAMLHLADVCLILEEPARAFQLFDGLLALNPTDYEVLVKYLTALEGTGRKATRLKVLKALFELDKNDRILGLKYMKALEEAGISTHIRDYLTVLETLMQDPVAANLIRTEYHRLKPAMDSIRRLDNARLDSLEALEQAGRDSAEKAEKAFQQVISSVLNEESTPLDTGRIIREIKIRLERDAQQSDLGKVGALLSFSRKNYAQALKFLSSLKASDDFFYEILALSHFKMGNHQEAVDAFQRLNRENLPVPHWKFYCTALEKSGQLKKAALEYEVLLQRHPDDEDALKFLIAFYRKPVNSKKLVPVLLAFSNIHPGNADLLLELASLSEGQPEKRADFLFRYLERKPADVKTALQLTALYEELGDTAQALTIFSRYRNRHKGDFNYFFKLGNLYRACGQIKNAISQYEEASSLNPSDSLLIICLTDGYLKAGRRQKASEAWDKYGRLVIRMNRPSQAKSAFIKSIQLGNQDSELKFLLAQIHMDNGEFDQVETLLEQAVKHKNNFDQAHFLRARNAAKRNQKGLAVEYLLQALKYAPENVQYSEFLGGLFHSSDEFEQAFKALHPVRNKLSLEARRIYADCLKKLGRKQSSLDDFQNSFNMAESTPQTVASLADSYNQQNRPDKAIEVIRESGFGNHALVKISLARAHSIKGNCKKARKILKEVDLKQKQTSPFFMARGFSYLKEADFSAAASDFDKALVFDPLNAEAKYQLGMCELRLNRPEKARKLFNDTRYSRNKSRQALSYWGIAGTFRREGKVRAEKHHLTRALETEFVPEIMANYIQFLIRNGDSAEALEWQQKLNTLDKTGNFAAQGAAEILFLEGRLKEAEATIQKGLEKHPFSCGLLLLLARSAAEADEIKALETRNAITAKLCADHPESFLYLGLAFLRNGDKKAAGKQFKKFRKFGGDVRLLPETF